MSQPYLQYVGDLERRIEQLCAISKKAREKGLDPSFEFECKVANDIADLVEGLVGPKGVAESIRELSSKIGREETAFKVTEEIIYGKFGHLEPEASAEQAIRTALAIFTEGLTAAPIQGVAKVAIKTNYDRTRYLAIYFAGPIRSAGGTDQALTLVVGDFIRRILGLDRYKPTEEEISRFIEELRIYERSVTRFQYHIPDKELRRALHWLPVEVTGLESNPVEVSSFRNIPRIETNRVRGGALRVLNDGIVGRASKVFTIIEKLGFQGWNWLKEVSQMSERSNGFMDDIIAGRPVFSFKSRQGGFRLRYGRARNTGLSAVGIHPATMLVLQGFLAGGTQLRMELPGKGGVVMPVDSLERPVVLLNDGSVVRVSKENFKTIEDRIERILFLGDILVNFGDFLYSSQQLAPSGYVEEWWVEDLHNAIMERFDGNVEKAGRNCKIPARKLQEILKNPFSKRPSVGEAIRLSSTLHIPFHPAFTPFWSNLSSSEMVKALREWLLTSEKEIVDETNHRIIGEMDSQTKNNLEKICLPHRILGGRIVIENENARILEFSLGSVHSCNLDIASAKTALHAVNLLSGIEHREKSPTLVGARMGRPEKAKRRAMKPLVHGLFPVGLRGGSRRNIAVAARGKPAFVEIANRKCQVCKTYTFQIKCHSCGSETEFEKSCPRCGKSLSREKCPVCKASARYSRRQVVNFRLLLEKASKNLGVKPPDILKGVKSLMNKTKTPEILEKGILRAIYDLSVYKDGTIRFDASNAPLTHFKPVEVGVTVERLKQLGYSHDIHGEMLKDADQICELKLQDVVIPIKSAEYFVRVAKFVDDLLSKMYDLSPYYCVKNEQDLIGHLIMGLAPHTCVGILGRIIGFTRLNVCYAHPIWHSAKRRDCDGDEDTIMLALDTLLNFSREFLPAQIGGIMDAPLLMIPIVNTKEVQRQALDFDVSNAYPIELYEKTWQKMEARQVSSLIDHIRQRLGTESQFEGFSYTTPTSNINNCNTESGYKQFKTMVEKLNNQLQLAEKIEAVDAKKVAFKVLTTHFMRDIAGNLRAFSTQSFRCKACNKKFRRLPLRGTCSSCGGLLTLTVYRGGIEKYLETARSLIEKYDLPNYYSQRISQIKDEICTLFEGGKPKQFSLVDFA